MIDDIIIENMARDLTTVVEWQANHVLYHNRLREIYSEREENLQIQILKLAADAYIRGKKTPYKKVLEPEDSLQGFIRYCHEQGLFNKKPFKNSKYI